MICSPTPLSRKVNKRDSKMSSRHQLAPNAKCAVCNDDASGFHYGVDSCEGCKGFFRRCITQGINFRCSNEEKCQITPFTRNSCQYCRLKRCFQVGMSREASRLGRRPKKVMKSSSLASRDFQAQLSKHIDAKLGNTNSAVGNNWDYPELAQDALSDVFGCAPEMMQKLSQMMPAMMSGQMPQFGAGDMMHPGMNPHNPMDMNSPVVDLSMQAGPARAPTIKKEAMAESVTHMDLNKWREKQYEVMSKYMHNKDSGSVGDQSEVSSSDGTVARDDTSLTGKNYSPMSTGSADLASPLSVSSMSSTGPHSPPIDADITAMSDEQRQTLLRYISYGNAERQPEVLSLIKEVQNAIIDSHMEHCYHLRPRINAVSAELDARVMQGEDVRPPSGFWAHWMSELLPTIERVVRFLKDIPGFRELPINDQIVLIKKGAFDIVLAQAMPMVDPEKLSMLDPQLKYRNTRQDFDLMPAPFRKLFDDYFILSREFRRAGITDIETSLINSVLGVNSSVQGFENPKAVEKLECLFVQTLHDYVAKKYPEQAGRFESLLRLIPMIDNTSQAHTNSLNKIKCQVPVNQGSFPPLHKEIFTSDL